MHTTRKTGRKAGIALATLTALGLAAAHPAQAVGFTYTTFVDPASPNFTEALGINNSGQIVGQSRAGAYVYTPRTGFTTLNDPTADANQTFAAGINNIGQVVGSYAASNTSHGYVYTPGKGYVTLDDPLAGPDGTAANGINKIGQVVGNYSNVTSGFTHNYGFLYTPGSGFTTLNDPAARLGATFANGINDFGQIVGSYADSAGVGHGFLFTPGTGPGSGFIPFNDPAATGSTVPRGINDVGQIVGTYYDNAPNDNFIARGFLFTPGTGPGSGFITLKNPSAIDRLGGTFATGFNSADQVVGYYNIVNGGNGGYNGFIATPTPVPEFSSAASFGLLFLMGAGGLCINARKRAKTGV